jgi:mannan endo-1,4-beta-mannosidase
MLEEAFDDEYERHLMWAHLASGGAGSGLRWPARHPHMLTPGMKRAIKSLAAFTRLVDWRHFASHNAASDIAVAPPGLLHFGCRDEHQAVIWLLRGDPVDNPAGRLPERPPLAAAELKIYGMLPGFYQVQTWDTLGGAIVDTLNVASSGAEVSVRVPSVGNDLALAVRRVE